MNRRGFFGLLAALVPASLVKTRPHGDVPLKIINTSVSDATYLDGIKYKTVTYEIVGYAEAGHIQGDLFFDPKTCGTFRIAHLECP